MFVIDDLLFALGIPALFEALGVGGAAAGAAGLGAEVGAGAGILGAEAGGLLGAEAAGAGLFGGAGAAGGLAGGESALAGLLGGSEALGGFGAEALSSFAAAPEAASGFFPDFGTTFGSFGGGTAGGIGAEVGASAGGLGADMGAKAISALPGAAESSGFLGSLGQGAMKSIISNPLGIGLAGAGLGYNMLSGQGNSANRNAMSANAAALNDQGKQLMSYMQTGTLPPGLQTATNNATAAMKARIVANHARTGGNTNPAQNSALAQELNQVDLNATALIAQQGQQLLNTGMNAVNMSNQLYGMLESLDRQQSQRMGQAIASFASALSGPARITVNAGGVAR